MRLQTDETKWIELYPCVCKSTFFKKEKKVSKDVWAADSSGSQKVLLFLDL